MSYENASSYEFSRAAKYLNSLEISQSSSCSNIAGFDAGLRNLISRMGNVHDV